MENDYEKSCQKIIGYIENAEKEVREYCYQCAKCCPVNLNKCCTMAKTLKRLKKANSDICIVLNI